MIETTPKLNIYDPERPVWTYQEQLPPAKFVFDSDGRRGMAGDSMVSGGCIVSGSEVSQSILFSNVHIHSYSSIEQSVTVRRKVKIRKAIIDRAMHIPDSTVIGYDRDQDIANGFRVTDKGLVLVTRGMLGQREGYA